MRRGTTPTNIFTSDVDCRDASLIYITYAQRSIKVIEKTIEDCEITETQISVHLSQEDTLLLKEGTVDIQIRVKFPDGAALASNIIRTTADKILKDGVI